MKNLLKLLGIALMTLALINQLIGDELMTTVCLLWGAHIVRSVHDYLLLVDN